MLQVLVIPFAQFVQSFIFLVNGNAFSKDSLLVQTLGLGSEVVNQQLNYYWDSDVPKLIVLQLVDILGDKGANCHLKLIFFLFLLLSQVLSLQIDAIAQKRWPALDDFWKLCADFFRDEGDKVFDWYFEMFEKLSTVLDGKIATGEYPVDGSESEIVISLDIESWLNQYKLP
jgi:hypothetical protein